MHKWISGGAFLVFGLLIGCGGRSSETTQNAPEEKTEQIIDKNGEVSWRITILGPDGDREKGTLDKNGPAAKR